MQAEVLYVLSGVTWTETEEMPLTELYKLHGQAMRLRELDKGK